MASWNAYTGHLNTYEGDATMEQHKQQTKAMEAILAAMQATERAWDECANLQRCPGAQLAMSAAYDALVRAGNAVGQAKEGKRGKA